METLETIAAHFGIEQLPPIAGTKSGPLLVMCPARCVWDDVHQVDLSNCDTLAVKEVSWFFVRSFYRPLNHAASYEETVNLKFTDGKSRGIPWAAQAIHTVQEDDLAGSYIWDVTKQCGTSGLFGVLVGVLMGYAPVMIAGSPLDDSPHFYDPHYMRYTAYTRQGQRNEWRKACEMFKGRALGLSGKPKEWLGGL